MRSVLEGSKQGATRLLGPATASAIKHIVVAAAVVAGLALAPATALASGPAALDSPGNGANPQVAYAPSDGYTYVAWSAPTADSTPPGPGGVDLCVVPAGSSSCEDGVQDLQDPEYTGDNAPTLGGLTILPGGEVVVLGTPTLPSPTLAWASPAGGAAFLTGNNGLQNGGSPISPSVSLYRYVQDVAPLSATDLALWDSDGDFFQDSAYNAGSPTISSSNGNPGGQFTGGSEEASGSEIAAEPAPAPAPAGTEDVVAVGENTNALQNKPSGCANDAATGYGVTVGTVGGSASGSLNAQGLPAFGLLDCTAVGPALAQGGADGIGVLEQVGSEFDGLGTADTLVFRAFHPGVSAATSGFGADVPVVTLTPHVLVDAESDDLSEDTGTGVYASWVDLQGLVLDYSPNGGANWDPPVALPSLSNDATQGNPVIAGVGGGNVEVAYDANFGTGTQVFLQLVDVGPRAPTNTAAPKLTGTPAAGKTLSCSAGGWANAPTGYAYQWYDDGTPIAGATGSKYKVTTLDEGTTLTCVVTASNAGGSGSASSKGDKVPVPFVAKCPGATGRLSGATLGLVKLGASRASEHYLYRHHSDRGKQYEDFFCLTPIGVRVGYGSPKLLKILTTKQRKALKDRVVWASTSNPFYAVDGVRAGEAISVASVKLHTGGALHIGLNYWYLAVQRHSTVVLKVRGGVVEEIGIATNLLTASAHDQNVLMHSFY